MVPYDIILRLIDKPAVSVRRAFGPLLFGGSLPQQTRSADFVVVFGAKRIVIHHIFQILLFLLDSFCPDSTPPSIWSFDDSILLDLNGARIVLIAEVKLLHGWRCHIVIVVGILHLGKVIRCQAAVRSVVVRWHWASILITQLRSHVQAQRPLLVLNSMDLLVVLTRHHEPSAHIIRLQILPRKMPWTTATIFDGAHPNISEAHAAIIVPVDTCAQILDRVSTRDGETLRTSCGFCTPMQRVKIRLRVANPHVLRWPRIIICGWRLPHDLSSEPTIVAGGSPSKSLPTLSERLLCFGWDNLGRAI